MVQKTSSKHCILVTGGCGFIGLNLVDFLLDKTNWQISVLDNLSNGSLKDLKKLKSYSSKRVKFYKGDIRDKQDVEKAISRCDYVVHLAAQTGVIPSLKDPFKDAEINILGTLNLLSVATKKKVKKFVFASSAAPLGQQKVPVNEQKVPQPVSPYGASKLAGEAYCSAYSGSFGLQAVVLRFSNVYGPWSYQKGSVVPQFAKRITDQQPVIIYGNGQQTRDFVYVADICQAIFLGLTKKLKGGFNLVQIGTGKETSVNHLFKLVEKSFSAQRYKVRPPVYKPERPGEIKRNYTDIAKAKRVLGYQPEVLIAEGIMKFVNWYKNS